MYLKDIYHFIDNDSSDKYYGFINIDSSAMLNFENLYLSSHDYTDDIGTYDFTSNSISNVIIKNMNYKINRRKIRANELEDEYISKCQHQQKLIKTIKKKLPKTTVINTLRNLCMSSVKL